MMWSVQPQTMRVAALGITLEFEFVGDSAWLNVVPDNGQRVSLMPVQAGSDLSGDTTQHGSDSSVL